MSVQAAAPQAVSVPVLAQGPPWRAVRVAVEAPAPPEVRATMSVQAAAPQAVSVPVLAQGPPWRAVRVAVEAPAPPEVGAAVERVLPPEPEV